MFNCWFFFSLHSCCKVSNMSLSTGRLPGVRNQPHRSDVSLPCAYPRATALPTCLNIPIQLNMAHFPFPALAPVALPAGTGRALPNVPPDGQPDKNKQECDYDDRRNVHFHSSLVYRLTSLITRLSSIVSRHSPSAPDGTPSTGTRGRGEAQPPSTRRTRRPT